VEPERWREVEKLYHAALERKPDEREAFLAAVSDSEEVRREVASLLAQSSGSGPLDRPLWGDSGSAAVTLDGEAHPVQSGRVFRQRAPWWMHVIAASYLVSAALTLYVEFRGPEDTGIKLAALLAPGPAVAAGVEPGSPAAQAGIEPNDRLVSFESYTVRSALDWVYALGEATTGEPLHVGIEHRGQVREVVLTLAQKTGVPRDLTTWVRIARALVALSLALVIAYSRPFDLQARIGALLLAEVGLFGLFFLNAHTSGMFAIVRQLPLPFILLVRAPLASPGGALLFAFAAIFPRALFRGVWEWTLVWIPQVATMCVRCYYHIYLVYAGDRLIRLPAWVKAAGVLYFIATVVVFILNYRRLQDRNERRRARVVAAGTVALIVAVLPYIVMLSPGVPVAKLEAVFLSPPVFVSLNLLSAAFPVSIAYAILRHRAFDISVVIRQGLKYAIARRTLLATLPLIGGILVADLLMNADRPLAAILQERGWIYLALGAGALLAHTHQRGWMDALDRRYFRERYDAQQLLREVAEEVRHAASFGQAARHVVAQIERALHPEFTALLIRRPMDAEYQVLAIAPVVATPLNLPAESKLLSMIRLLGKPMEVTLTENGWLRQQLPPEETHLLMHARIEWLIPIAMMAERNEALLALGFKLSEEPYTRDDQNLLIAIAASLSLLLERPTAARPAVTESFEECPECGSLYSRGTARCSREGTKLSVVGLPRVLADRYRLDRRLGGGGMGTVYESSDTALERCVATKVMREELVGNAIAAERFRREARAAAAFSHLNVVTIHDFGVAGTRAFLIMELLTGVNLRTEMKRSQRFPAARVVEIMCGICAALHAAHERGIVHRDVKPENIFLARTAETEIPKVLDFGLAKFVPTSSATESTNQTGAWHLIGTLRYMSPEQFRGELMNPSWDLWALAIVVYEMLAGKYPFEGHTGSEWQSALMCGSFTPVTQHMPDAPPAWHEFFRQALAVEQERRPATARTFFSELQNALSE
jgi:serine/threonine-protein kinase